MGGTSVELRECHNPAWQGCRGTQRLSAGTTSADRSGVDHGQSTQGARPLRVRHQVQLEHRAAVYQEVPPRVGCTALAVPERNLHGRHGRSPACAAWDDAKGLSANVVSRLKAQWADEHEAWNHRDLSLSRYVYWWVDGIHTGLRSEHSDGQCLLVIVGVAPDGRKERVAIGDGYRESKESWKEVLLDLKHRGLQAGPLLAVGDGAMGFWAAIEEVFPHTGHQRCWFHKMGNVLNALPKSQHGRANADMQAIWMAATRDEAH